MRSAVIETLTSARLRQSYSRIRHRSGLTVCVLPKRSAVTCGVIGVNFGANDRTFRLPGGEVMTLPAGTAHFLEHKMFAARDGEEDAIARFARIGANADAYTTPDLTAYQFSTTDAAYPALEILLDFLFHPYFTEENVEKERAIIAQEIRMYDDTPVQAGYYGLMEAMYHTHPIRDNVGGTEASIRQITPELLYTCHKAFYRPDNMTLCVAGRVEADGVLSVLDRCLPERGEHPAPERIFVPEPVYPAVQSVQYQADAAIPLLYLGFKDPILPADSAARMRRAAAADILNDILFCRSSPIYADLYTRGLINGRFGAEYEYADTYGYALISAESAQYDAVDAQIRQYLADRRALHDITDAQFSRCRRVMYASAVTAFESAEDMAAECLDCEMEGTDMFTPVDVMMQITKEDLFYVLDTLYLPKQLCRCVVT